MQRKKESTRKALTKLPQLVMSGHGLVARIIARLRAIIEPARGKKRQETEIADDRIITDISSILHARSQRTSFFMDSRGLPVRTWRIMRDISKGQCLPDATKLFCWWCRHGFPTSPIGCPVSIIRHRHSVDGERFPAERDNDPRDQGTAEDSAMMLILETEGMFCSFPCCKSWATEQQREPRYASSLTLLQDLYHRCGGEGSIPQAPSWKLLKEYGGSLTIKEYRTSMGILAFHESANRRGPLLFSSSQYIAEQRLI